VVPAILNLTDPALSIPTSQENQMGEIISAQWLARVGKMKINPVAA
jgi:hypothetical protein